MKKVNPNKSVSFHNDLFESPLMRDPVYDLNLPQLKIVMYAVSQVEPDDEQFNEVVVSVQDFCDTFHISYNGGKNREILENHIDMLMEKPLKIKTERKTGWYQWVEYAELDTKAQTITLKLSSKLKPFYLNLKNNFTSFKIGFAAEFKSKHTLVLYETLKRWETYNGGHFFYDVEEAKKQLARGKYKLTSDFIRRVIEPAVNEINEKSDLTVSYGFKKKGKKIVTICFSIRAKTSDDIKLLQANWNTDMDIFSEEKTIFKELDEELENQMFFDGFEPEEKEESEEI